MTLSLFGGKKHLHHFVAEQDVAKELFALLVEAKTGAGFIYRREWINLSNT